MKYQDHKNNVLSKRKYFTELDIDEIICPKSDDEFFPIEKCKYCKEKKDCEVWR